MLELIDKDIFGEIEQSDALCIATNCTILSDGTNPMGAMAGAAARRWPKIPQTYGSLLQVVGNIPVILGWVSKTNKNIFDNVFAAIPYFQTHETTIPSYNIYSCAIVGYPTMHEIGAPASLDLVVRSAHLLVEMANAHRWERIVMGRSGCGVGGLDWEKQVKPKLSLIFDDRFVAMHK